MHYTLVALILVGSSYLYYLLAQRLHIIDKPNERSSHTKPTVRGGGIVFLVAMVLFFFMSDFAFPYFFVALCLLALISFIDDMRSLGFKIRLLVQFLALALVFYELHLLDVPWWALVVVAVISVGFLNIFNFMDGINGITGLYSLAVLSGFFIINRSVQLVPDGYIICAILSIAVFGFYNFRKRALFFAGDIGSMSMAMIILFLVLKYVSTLAAPCVLLLLGVYLVDGGLTIIRRLLKRENIFKPHRSHLYQTLVHQTKLTHLQVAAGYALLQFTFILPVLYLLDKAVATQILGLLLGLLLLAVLHFILISKLTSKTVSVE